MQLTIYHLLLQCYYRAFWDHSQYWLFSIITKPRRQTKWRFHTTKQLPLHDRLIVSWLSKRSLGTGFRNGIIFKEILFPVMAWSFLWQNLSFHRSRRHWINALGLALPLKFRPWFHFVRRCAWQKPDQSHNRNFPKDGRDRYHLRTSQWKRQQKTSSDKHG